MCFGRKILENKIRKCLQTVTSPLPRKQAILGMYKAKFILLCSEFTSRSEAGQKEHMAGAYLSLSGVLGLGTEAFLHLKESP